MSESPLLIPDRPLPARAGTYRSLDAWRGIACLAVCAYHAAQVVVEKRLHGATTPLYSAASFGCLGVQLFFVISGYCIAASAASLMRREGPVGSFVAARCRRIFPACWASLLLFAVVGYGAAALVSHGVLASSSLATEAGHGRDVRFWLSNLTLMQIPARRDFLSPVCWSLCYELSFYLIVAGAIATGRRLRRPQSALRGLDGLTVFTLLMLIAVPQWMAFPLDLWPQFGMGVLAFRWASGRDRRWVLGVTIVVVIETVAFVLLRDAKLSIMEVPSRLMFSVALAYAAALVLLFPFDTVVAEHPVVRWLARVGVISYSLYLTHFLTLGLANQLFRKALARPSLHYVQFGASMVVAVAVAAVFYRLAERPFLKARSPRPDVPPGTRPSQSGPADVSLGGAAIVGASMG